MVATTGQSYASASIGRVSIANGSVLLEIVSRGRERHENAGKAVAVRGDALDGHAGRGTKANAELAKSLDDAGAKNDLVALGVHVDAHFAGPGRGAWCLQVRATGHREAVQLQRQSRCAERNARCADHGAGHVADELTIFDDGQRARDRAADVRSL